MTACPGWEGDTHSGIYYPSSRGPAWIGLPASQCPQRTKIWGLPRGTLFFIVLAAGHFLILFLLYASKYIIIPFSFPYNFLRTPVYVAIASNEA